MLPMCPNSLQTVPMTPPWSIIASSSPQSNSRLSCHSGGGPFVTSPPLRTSPGALTGGSTGGEGPTTWGDTLSYTPVTSLELSSITEESPPGVGKSVAKVPTPRISLGARRGVFQEERNPMTWAILHL